MPRKDDLPPDLDPLARGGVDEGASITHGGLARDDDPEELALRLLFESARERQGEDETPPDDKKDR
jgi:hypothetical protein